jgi:hypothetical protein
MEELLMWQIFGVKICYVHGSTNDQIRNNFKKAYNDKGIKVLVSFFGST